jgi:hypothetical protein
MINLNETIKGKPRWMRIMIIVIGLTLPILMLVAGIIVAIWIFEICTCGISSTYELNAPYFRSLPSDEEMIAHFQKHRADFERLVQVYREDPLLPTRWGWVVPTPPIKAIMERAKVNEMHSDWIVWMPPDPYSDDAKQKIKTLGLSRRASRYDPAMRKFGGVFLGYGHPQVRRLNWYLSDVYKGYYYAPFPPRIEKGRLKTPHGDKWISPTLDSYPSNLISGNCVYRQFEPQWFLELCQGL